MSVPLLNEKVGFLYSNPDDVTGRKGKGHPSLVALSADSHLQIIVSSLLRCCISCQHILDSQIIYCLRQHHFVLLEAKSKKHFCIDCICFVQPVKYFSLSWLFSILCGELLRPVVMSLCCAFFILCYFLFFFCKFFLLVCPSSAVLF